MTNDMPEDNDLIREFQSGDEKSFDKLVEKHLQNVFGFFLKITSDKMTAEDLSQDVFMKLYKNLRNFRHESSFLPICSGSIRIPQTPGSQEISGKISSTLTRHQRGENLTDQLIKNGKGKSCGMEYQGYQKNSVPW